MKEEKSEIDPKQREHHEFWTKTYLILIRSKDFFLFFFFFFVREEHDFGTKIALRPRISDNFFVKYYILIAICKILHFNCMTGLRSHCMPLLYMKYDVEQGCPNLWDAGRIWQGN